MKLIVAALAVLGLTIGSATAAPVLTMAAADHALALSVDQGQPPSGQLDVDIDVNKGGATQWYTSPVWIAIGVVALLVILALIITATRGGGTTVIKE